MDVEVDRSDIRDLVFDYLRSFQELSDVKTKDVRTYIQSELDLPEHYFKGERKEMLVDIIAEYRSASSQQTSKSSAAKGQTAEFKTGKFSKEESDLILKTVKRYAEEQGIPLEDLDTSARNKEGGKASKHLDLWRELGDLLPDRKREAIWHHAQRILARPRTGDGRFTPEDITRLKELVKIHGRNFIVIGGLMDKLPDDCQQVLLRSERERKVTGFFSAEEDARIVEALRIALKLPGADILDLPSKRLPWTSVAALLSNERLPLDYSRRYSAILRKAELRGQRQQQQQQQQQQQPDSGASAAPALSTLPSTAATLRVKSGRLSRGELSINARRLQLLRRLQDGGYADESEVNWAQLDREFNFHAASSLSRWKVLLKSCPVDDADVGTFEERLDYLVDLFSKQASPAHSDAEPDNPSGTSTTSNSKQIAAPASKPAKATQPARPAPAASSSKKPAAAATIAKAPALPPAAAATSASVKPQARRGVVTLSDSDNSDTGSDRSARDHGSGAKKAAKAVSKKRKARKAPSSDDSTSSSDSGASSKSSAGSARSAFSFTSTSSSAGSEDSDTKGKPSDIKQGARNGSKNASQKPTGRAAASSQSSSAARSQQQWGTSWKGLPADQSDSEDDGDPYAVPPFAQSSQHASQSQSQTQTQAQTQTQTQSQPRSQVQSKANAREEIEISSSSDSSSADVISVSSGQSSSVQHTPRSAQSPQSPQSVDSAEADPEAEFDLIFSPAPKPKPKAPANSTSASAHQHDNGHGSKAHSNATGAAGSGDAKAKDLKNLGAIKGAHAQQNQQKDKGDVKSDVKDVLVKVDSDLSASDIGDPESSADEDSFRGHHSGSKSKLDKKPATTKEQKVKAEKGAAAGAAASPSHRGSDKSTSKAAGGAPISNAPISMDKIYAVDNEVEVDEHPVQPKSKPGSQPGSQPKSQPKSQLPPRQASQAAAAAPAPGNVTATASDKAIPSTTGVSAPAKAVTTKGVVSYTQETAHSEADTEDELPAASTEDRDGRAGSAAPAVTSGEPISAMKKKKNKKKRKRALALDSDSDSGSEGSGGGGDLRGPAAPAAATTAGGAESAAAATASPTATAKKNSKKRRKSLAGADTADDGATTTAAPNRSTHAEAAAATDMHGSTMGSPGSNKKKKKKSKKKARHSLEDSGPAAAAPAPAPFYGGVSEVVHRSAAAGMHSTAFVAAAAGQEAREGESKEERKRRKKMEKALLAREDAMI